MAFSAGLREDLCPHWSIRGGMPSSACFSTFVAAAIEFHRALHSVPVRPGYYLALIAKKHSYQAALWQQVSHPLLDAVLGCLARGGVRLSASRPGRAICRRHWPFAWTAQRQKSETCYLDSVNYHIYVRYELCIMLRSWAIFSRRNTCASHGLMSREKMAC